MVTKKNNLLNPFLQNKKFNFMSKCDQNIINKSVASFNSTNLKPTLINTLSLRSRHTGPFILHTINSNLDMWGMQCFNRDVIFSIKTYLQVFFDKLGNDNMIYKYELDYYKDLEAIVLEKIPLRFHHYSP